GRDLHMGAPFPRGRPPLDGVAPDRELRQARPRASLWHAAAESITIGLLLPNAAQGELGSHREAEGGAHARLGRSTSAVPAPALGRRAGIERVWARPTRSCP